MFLKAHTENVLVQAIENEILIVNLENGIYYSLTGSAAVIFSLLDSGVSTEELADKVQQLYGEQLSQRPTNVDEFIHAMTEEALMIPGRGSCGLIPADYMAGTFQPPELKKYDDLQELLLLDPVRGLPTSEAGQ
ncbi:MAG: PqqD family protein [Cyanobacteria bacterium]|nr:PqqD family protein [Cyanobacteriota bacterium]